MEKNPPGCLLNRSFVLKNLHPSFACWCPSRMNFCMYTYIYIWYVFTHQTRFSVPSCKSFHLKLLGPVKVVLPIESYHLFKGLEFLSISGLLTERCGKGWSRRPTLEPKNNAQTPRGLIGFYGQKQCSLREVGFTSKIGLYNKNRAFLSFQLG